MKEVQSTSWNLMLLCGVCIYGSHAVLLNLSKVDGKIPFNSASVVFFIELCKLLISVMMLLPELISSDVKRVAIPSPKQFIVYSIPAILYSFNNNIVVHIQTYMDPASFQILSNLKIVSTALLYRAILSRPIATRKWLAFVMITIAGAFNSYGGIVSTHGALEKSDRRIYVTITGLFLVLIYCSISGTAAVYTEYILKKQARLSFATQSIMMYVFGIVTNSTVFFLSNIFSTQDDLQGVSAIFNGYSFWTIIIIVTQAFNGLINGAIMKHANNLTRLIMVAGAMLVSTILSVLVFGIQFNIHFTVAFILVLIAMYIYYQQDISYVKNIILDPAPDSSACKRN